MPNTRSPEDELAQPTNEIEHSILKIWIRKLRLEYNIPNLDMAANQNRPLKDYAAPSQE